MLVGAVRALRPIRAIAAVLRLDSAASERFLHLAADTANAHINVWLQKRVSTLDTVLTVVLLYCIPGTSTQVHTPEQSCPQRQAQRGWGCQAGTTALECQAQVQ